MKALFTTILVLTIFASSGCNAQELKNGSYHASVPFTGNDPRYIGQDYDWYLHLNTDTTFTFSFELPLAIYTESGEEIVGKATARVTGNWKQSGKTLLLTRNAGEGSLGSTNTISFSFHDNQITILASQNGIILQEDNRQLELKKLPNKPDTGDGK